MEGEDGKDGLEAEEAKDSMEGEDGKDSKEGEDSNNSMVGENGKNSKEGEESMEGEDIRKGKDIKEGEDSKVLGKARDVVEQLLKEVVDEVVADGWMFGIRDEAEELLELLDMSLGGEQDDVIDCNTCGKIFSSRRLLYFHERNQHVDPGNCNFCDTYFTSKVKLNTHIQKMHTYGPQQQPRTYMCELCGKVFKARSNLSQHMKSHNKKVLKQKKPPAKSFPCNNCQKSFKRQWNLKRHIALKHKKRVCGRQMRISLYMNKSSAKKIPCSICKKLFKRRCNLFQHMNIVHKMRRKAPRSSSPADRK